MTLKHIAIAAGVALAIASAIVVVSLVNASRAEDTASLGRINGSYAFDVKDKRQLVSYADDVFIGEIVGVERTEPDASSTIWRVAVVTGVKGEASGEVLVRQLGYVDDEGRAHPTEEQPLLEPGRRYLLATTRNGDEHVLVAGPAASVRARDRAMEASLIAEYRAAMR